MRERRTAAVEQPASLDGTGRAGISRPLTVDLANLRLALHLDDELDTRKLTKRFYG